MDTDALLQPIQTAESKVTALKCVVAANTEAFREIAIDLSKCNSQEKTLAILYKVLLAIQDLAIESQKIPPWVTKDDPSDAPAPNKPHGQYPIYAPLNPDNSVPWPPGYTCGAVYYLDLAGSYVSGC